MNEFEMNNRKIIKETRLKALCDVIFFNLKTNKITFDEERIRETLNKIDDELSLKNIMVFSARLGNVDIEEILGEYDEKYMK